jgi:cytochrome oxidase Cu insertion factor (SCO1/SenC/PrrC family)
MTPLLRTFAFTAATALLLAPAATSATAAAKTKAARVAPPAVGAQAPDFKLVDQDGKRVTLSALRGQKVVLVFYRGYW